jgi:hypothetical protein
LNRDNINSLLDGDVFTLPKGVAFCITEESDIVLQFAETDEDLEKQLPFQGSDPRKCAVARRRLKSSA